MVRDWADASVGLCKHRCKDKEACKHTICCRQYGIRDRARIDAAVAAATAAATAATAAATPGDTDPGNQDHGAGGNQDGGGQDQGDANQDDANQDNANQSQAPTVETNETPRTQVEMDREMCTNFETEATFGLATADNIVESFDSIPPEELRNIAHAIEAWQTARNTVFQAKQNVTATEAFTGSLQDDDEFGDELQHRPTFAQYETCENTLLQALQTLRDQANALIAARRADWRARSSGQWLDARIALYNDEITGQANRLATLPEVKAEAEKKLVVRTRRARGILGPSWVGSWQLPTVSTGRSLWLKQDGHGIIRDRVVIKDTFFPATGTESLWEDPNLWTGGSPNDANSVPNEVQAMYNLRGKIGSETIVKIRNWRLRRAERMHRIMTEYCSHGDLFDQMADGFSDQILFIRQLRPDLDLRAPEGDEILQELQDPHHVTALQALRADTPYMVPEPFIWSVVEALAIAGLLMERGELDSGSIVPWDQIIHCDWKHENLFVSPPHETRYLGYPQVKLGDFGFALIIEQNDTRAPENFANLGTAETMAPEQHMYTANDNETPKMMSSATNVYGAGTALWQLLSQSGIPLPTDTAGNTQQPILSDPNWYRRKNFEPPALDGTATAYYSPTLVALIRSMCRHDDQSRPTFNQILKRTRAFVNSLDYPARGLREAPASDPRYAFGPYHLRRPRHFRGDEYPLGLAMNAVPMEAFCRGPGGSLPALPASRGADDEDSVMSDDLGGGPAVYGRPNLAPAGSV